MKNTNVIKTTESSFMDENNRSVTGFATPSLTFSKLTYYPNFPVLVASLDQLQFIEAGVKKHVFLLQLKRLALILSKSLFLTPAI